MSIVDELVANLGFSFQDCLRVISTAPARYFVFEIDKKTGGKRVIAHPAKELKEIQRYLLSEKLNKIPVHASATAYSEGCSIRKNAAVHQHSEVILKLDFEEFFLSITPVDLVALIRRRDYVEVSREDLPYYLKVLFWSKEKNNVVPRCLSIGAPTSPALSNMILFRFDEECSRWCIRNRVLYTRYADDITLSAATPQILLRAEMKIRAMLSNMKTPKLSINESKRGIFSKGGRRSVTGLILTPDEKISMGRSRKRKISSMINHFSKGALTSEETAFLKGMLGFSIAVEVDFVERMRSKYGSIVIDNILSYYIPSASPNQYS